MIGKKNHMYLLVTYGGHHIERSFSTTYIHLWIHCILHAFSVTEIGDKEKMKNKLLATIVVLTLLIGTFAMAIQFSPVAQSITLYHLSMYTDPPAVPVSPGTGDYTPGTLVQLNFTDPVIIGSNKYVFTGWDIDNTWFGATNPLQYVTMNADHNVTAHYSTSHKFTVNYPWDASWLESFTPYIWQEGLGFVTGTGANGTYSAWIPQYALVQAGISSPESSPYYFGTPWIRGMNYQQCVVFTNWTNLGYYESDPYAWSNAGQINMTGPKTATMAFKMDFLLSVTSNTGSPVGGTGWYDQGTNVTLTAPDYSLNFGVYKYTLDHWTVDNVTVAGNPTIFVIMNTDHIAEAYYKRQSFVYLMDNLGNFSGIQDSGKWYDDGVNYTFNAPTPLLIGPGVRYDFRFWDMPGYGWTSSSNPLVIAFDASWDGEHLRGRWQTQYMLTVFKSPSTVPSFLYPDSDNTGWFDSGATINLKALPTILVPPANNTKYLFLDWKDHLGGTYGVGNFSFTIYQPVNMTAEYKLQYLAKWQAMPSSITVPGFPGQTWVDNNTWIAYGAPATDTSTQFVFYYWTINSVTYNQGNTTIPLFVSGPIDGTAYYANSTKITMTPDSRYEISPAYCNKFNVTITASNFDANRFVGPQPMDIYGFEFRIQWNTSLLEVTNVYLNLDAFFGPNAYFIAKNEIGAGYYLIAATLKYNNTGFSGTKPMLTLEFHVIKDACYNQVLGNWIYFQVLQLSNHLGNSIWPELGYNNCWYQITAPQPTLEIRNAVDHTNVVTVSKNVPTSYFDAEVYLNTGVKVHDFRVQVTYNSAMLMAESVVIGNYLQAPYSIFYWDVSTPGSVWVQVVQDGSVPLQNGSGVLFTIHFKVTAAKFWKTSDPWPMTSMISINYAWLSVMCPTPAYQITGGLLGVKANLQYNYNPLPGDLNFDGGVDVLDLQLIRDHYHTPLYDIVANSDTDLYDLVFVALRFGNHI